MRPEPKKRASSSCVAARLPMRSDCARAECIKKPQSGKGSGGRRKMRYFHLIFSVL
jgi:hypothetical protein